MCPTPPSSPSYRDDRYAVYAAGGTSLLGALLAFACSELARGPVALVADELVVPLALAAVGFLIAGAGTSGETVHRRLVSDTRERRFLLSAGGLTLVTPAVTTLTNLAIGDGSDAVPAWETLALLAVLPIAIAVCWRLLDVVRDRRRDVSPQA